MGEAKRRAGRGADPSVIYHHTSTLYTSFIWMSGSLRPEGAELSTIPHPHCPEGLPSRREHARRACADFPPLVWSRANWKSPGACAKTGRSIC
jgi:hypothetical protein